jgi:hypothetical protein
VGGLGEGGELCGPGRSVTILRAFEFKLNLNASIPIASLVPVL